VVLDLPRAIRYPCSSNFITNYMVLAQHKEGNILLGAAEWYFEGRSKKSSNTLFQCHVIGYLN